MPPWRPCSSRQCWWPSSRSSEAAGVPRGTACRYTVLTTTSIPSIHLWRLLGRIAVAALVAALAICTVLIARPAHVDRDAERSSSRDIVLCLDVSGSALPYDRAVIETYLELVSHFRGERIALSIFNSTSRTVFPLTDDYDLVSSQLTKAADALRGVESQDDIDKMSDKDYQKIADWLEGTQNRKNSTSLIGDGLVSCAAMIPGFAYGDTSGAPPRSCSPQTTWRPARRRIHSPRRSIWPKPRISAWTACSPGHARARATPQPPR